jgi:hypothetical protein
MVHLMLFVMGGVISVNAAQQVDQLDCQERVL